MSRYAGVSNANPKHAEVYVDRLAAAITMKVGEFSSVLSQTQEQMKRGVTMADVTRNEVISIWTTPDELRQIAAELEDRWNKSRPDQALPKHIISSEDENLQVEILIKQSAMPPR